MPVESEGHMVIVLEFGIKYRTVMFGGLSVKGDSKQEPSSSVADVPASSGFLFLHSSIGAPKPTLAVSSSGALVASGVKAPASEPQPAAVAKGAIGSAFGFMPGAASGMGRTAAAASPLAPSRFAGLATSSSAAVNALAAEPATAAPTSSGFSFLSAPSPAPPPPVPSAATVASELSSGVRDAASASSTAGSSFSFMNSKGSAAGSTPGSMGEGSDHRECAGEDGGVKLEGNLALVQEKEGTAVAPTPAPSGFSFLSSGAAPAPSPPAAVHPSPLISEAAQPAKPAPSAPAGDLLSLSNPGLPMGSGVSWSAPPTAAGVGRRVVKKKRGKRVRVGAGAASAQLAPIPDPERTPSPQPPSAAGPSPRPPSPAMTLAAAAPLPALAAPSSPIPYGTDRPDSATPIRIKADRAVDRAEEFIREKQRERSAIAMAAERAMQDREGGGGPGLMPRSSLTGSPDSGWKINNSAPGSPRSPTDETYRAAKAAAEEARKLDHHQPKGKSLFSNFFGRGKSGGGNNGSGYGISSHSSHGGVVAGGGRTSPVSGDGFQRGGSNGSVVGGGTNQSPLPPMKETLEIALYGNQCPTDNAKLDGDASEEKKLKDMELEQEKQPLDVEWQQRQTEAEKNRREDEWRHREDEDRLERECRIEEERERRRSPRQKMQVILDNLAGTTRTTTDEMSSLRERRTELVQRKADAEKAERYAAQQLGLAEVQQALSAEEEDFEAADRLGMAIERHTKERKEQSRIRAGIDDVILRLDGEIEASARAVSACFADACTKLRELEGDVDDRSKAELVEEQFQKTSKRLTSEAERLASDLKHIERDEAVLAEEQKDLNRQIAEETKEFEETRRAASTKLDEVNKTIESLYRQLAEAEAAASDLNAKISSYQQTIQNIRSKYSRQLSRLEKKEKSVRESHTDWESEKESVERAKAAHEAVVAAHLVDMTSREKLIEDIRAESSVANDLEGIVSAAFAEAVVLNSDGVSALDRADSEVLKYEAAVNEAKQNVIAAEANIQSLQEELSAIKARLPILEAEKKMSASRRDFKAAGRASKQIKDASSRRERCAAELAGEAMERKQFANDELEKITMLLEEKRIAAAERGKEAGMRQMGLLKEKIGELKVVLKRFMSENYSDDNEDAINVSCVGAFVIESQIGVLEAEGKSLGEKFGGWEAAVDVVDDPTVRSAPSFDSVEDESNIAMDKRVLEKYNSLMSEIKYLDGAIQKAVEREDFDKAANLEERVQSLRNESENAGFSLAKFERALKDFTGKVSDGAASTASADDIAKNGDSSEQGIDSSVLERYNSLCADIKEWEADIESAVADEDYDQAVVLAEKVQSARSDIESLGFPIDDLKGALQSSAADEVVDADGKKEEGDAPEDNGCEQVRADKKKGGQEAPSIADDVKANGESEAYKG